MKRLSSMLLVLVMLLALGIPCLAASEVFEVRTQPQGAVYLQGDEAIPLQAVFAFNPDRSAQFSEASLRWYVSTSDSIDDRSNGFEDAEAVWTNDMECQTSLIPDTSTVGVRYYYAVLSYQAYFFEVGFSEPSAPVDLEIACMPARVEVVAPRPQEISFTVMKTDEQGYPLSGAVLRLQPDEAYSPGQSLPIYRDVSWEGAVTFTILPGYYILSEEQAPDGYEISGETYRIAATANGLMLDYHSQNMRPFEPITFVNRRIPAPSKPEPVVTEPTPSEPEPESVPAETEEKPPLLVITVKTTDEDGNPLSGEELSLRPDPDYHHDEELPSYTETTKEGLAEFTVVPGHYILNVEKAPPGYNASYESYAITVTVKGIYVDELPSETITLINRKIPALNKKDHFAFMAGYPDGRFGPEQNMTRAEAVVMFARLLVEGMTMAEDHRNRYYPDVASTAWYANEVGYMQSLGVLIAYCRDGNFRPGEYVTRAEFATLAAHFDDLELVDTNAFTDVSDDHWAVRYINSAAAKGWISGYGDGTFKPESHITRAEVVALVGRMLNRSADGAYLKANSTALPRIYTDIASSHWAYLSVMEASVSHDYIADTSGEHWTTVYK